MNIVLLLVILLGTGETRTYSKAFEKAETCWEEAETTAAEIRKLGNIVNISGGCFELTRPGERKA